MERRGTGQAIDLAQICLVDRATPKTRLCELMLVSHWGRTELLGTFSSIFKIFRLAFNIIEVKGSIVAKLRSKCINFSCGNPGKSQTLPPDHFEVVLKCYSEVSGEKMVILGIFERNWLRWSVGFSSVKIWSRGVVGQNLAQVQGTFRPLRATAYIQA